MTIKRKMLVFNFIYFFGKIARNALLYAVFLFQY